MIKNMICIVCPRGCHLTVEQTDNDIKVQGNNCPRGIPYAQAEMTHPLRMVTSTVRFDGSQHHRLPVVTSGPVPKDRMADVMCALNRIEIKKPVHRGDVLVANILGLAVDLVATKTLND